MSESHDPTFGSENAGGRPPRKRSLGTILLQWLGIVALLGILVSLMLPAVRRARPAANRNACHNNLKQIAIGLREYVAKHGALPPAYTTDENGKPLHSWRTLILPFIEERALYESIDLTKPWDDPVNEKAFKTIVSAYLCPGNPDPDNRTTYLAVVAPNSCIRATEGRKLAEISDKAERTLMVIEVGLDHAVPWMSPVDASEQLVLELGEKAQHAHPGGVNGAFVDGHVTFILNDTPISQLRAIISVAGNDDAEAALVD